MNLALLSNVNVVLLDKLLIRYAKEKASMKTRQSTRDSSKNIGFIKLFPYKDSEKYIGIA